MKKWKLYAAMAVAVLSVAGTVVPVHAAESEFVRTQINGKTCYVKVITVPGWCPPQENTPETPEVPEVPEVPETPEVPEAPETPEVPEEASSYAAQVVRLVNEERAKEGLSALTIDAGLEAAGNVRAKEIVSSFSHTRPNGSSFATAIQEQGVSYRSSGENIAWGQRSPEEVVDAWMNSPGHRANIMNAKFTRIGVGHYQNGAGTNYWAQLFAD